MRETKKKQQFNWCPFEEARTFARSLGLKSQAEWVAWTKSNNRPNDIPVAPSKTYKNEGWLGFGDRLGTGNISTQNRIYLPFEEARTVSHSLRLKGKDAWANWSKSGDKPDDIPTHPDRTYKHQGWIGWGDWLGTGTIASQNSIYLPFDEARVYVRSLGFKSKDEWVNWAKSVDKP